MIENTVGVLVVCSSHHCMSKRLAGVVVFLRRSISFVVWLRGGFCHEIVRRSSRCISLLWKRAHVQFSCGESLLRKKEHAQATSDIGAQEKRKETKTSMYISSETHFIISTEHGRNSREVPRVIRRTDNTSYHQREREKEVSNTAAVEKRKTIGCRFIDRRENETKRLILVWKSRSHAHILILQTHG